MRYVMATATEVAPEGLADLRGVGMNLCQATRLCPASQYLVCGCLETGRNCWEIEGKPCCKRDDFERCLTCEIYLAAAEKYEASE